MIFLPVLHRVPPGESRIARLALVRAALREYRRATRKMRRVLLANARLYHTLALRWPVESNLRWTLEHCAEESRELAARRSSLAQFSALPKRPGLGEWLARGICRWGSLRFAWSWLLRRETRAVQRVLRALECIHHLVAQRAGTSTFCQR